MLTDSALCSSLALLDQAGALACSSGHNSSIGGEIGWTIPNNVELLGQGESIDSFGYPPCKQKAKNIKQAFYFIPNIPMSTIYTVQGILLCICQASRICIHRL